MKYTQVLPFRRFGEFFVLRFGPTGVFKIIDVTDGRAVRVCAGWIRQARLIPSLRERGMSFAEYKVRCEEIAPLTDYAGRCWRMYIRDTAKVSGKG